MSYISINNTKIGEDHPTYFIAEIGSNFDGDIERAKDLIHRAKDAGANAAKFQHYSAKTLVSDCGFKNLSSNNSHQASWKKSVFETYEDASLDREWTATLKTECDNVGLDFLTSPYSLDLVDYVDEYIPAYKIGSGDITWTEIISYIAKKNKPVLLATGASNIEDVRRAVNEITKYNPNVVVMQCNTNYTASNENLRHIHLNVLKTFRSEFPQLQFGLSDHTHGHVSVLGAVALGARVIEKHFTDSNDRSGPDHSFAMTPSTWMEMVERTRDLELCLGMSEKKIEENEIETSVLQRRAIYARRKISKGELLTKDDIDILRPCPSGAFQPYDIDKILNKEVTSDIKAMNCIFNKDIKLK